jgi:hypothetical protein
MIESEDTSQKDSEESVNDAAKGYWFPGKRNGWGWGLPIRWQGWAVLIVYWIAILSTTVLLDTNTQQWIWIGFFVFYTLIVLLFMWKKGEPPRWRWRKKSRSDWWKTW